MFVVDRSNLHEVFNRGDADAAAAAGISAGGG
jgi:hypothetical protein